ncbi:PLDc N-terminal domain-containing protein [Stutzerimonas nitrititolerans]|uniref:PLDc N-terminal domain-containing protein n=1 Tax=Stutzerimonas nitrititolerans TaxID=2482751 RepID=UPI0028AC5668|nr:PLDc N-terminal domain-containing protein [Stutzerimonas nitrititolerans]
MDDLNGVLAVLILLLDVLAIVQVWRTRIETGRKIIWSLVIALLPVVGLVMWFVAMSRIGKVRL